MLFILSLLIAAVAAIPTVTVTRTSPTTITSTLTTTSNSVVGLVFGYRANATDNYISNGLICTMSASSTCNVFTCTSAAACTLGVATTALTPAEAFTSATLTQTIVTAVRDVTRSVAIGTLPMVYISWAEWTTGFTANAAQIQGATLADIAIPALYTVAAPTFGLTFGRPSATTLSATIVPEAGRTVMMGWKANFLAPLPNDGVICTLAASGTCIEFTCSIDASGNQVCAAPGTSILTSNAVTTTNAIIVRTLAAGTFNPVVDPMYIAHFSVATSGTYTPASAQGRAWTDFRTPLPAWTPTTVPTFNVSFARPTDTTLTISITPPATTTIYFGWRSEATVGWPADVVICAAGAVATCLDVSCTAANTCTARATTIFTTNTVAAGSISLARTLASGNVPLSATKDMYLAYTSAPTPAGTTTLSATDAQSRTWSYYTAPVPATGTTSNANTFIPSVIAAMCMLLYVL